MLSISCPELVYFYHQVGKQAPRQVVDPSMGVSSQTNNRSTQEVRRKTEGEDNDFSSVFAKVMNRGS
ncbi:hypothetical protein [Candidatus Magnetaquicoccus inordinatus]|uniref:hypothetical protein n=1 Tax=Candidatus Magnetaquicoccus inordinatus TaxID=2496818 RepID=UPI00102CACBA|nr:hypothetical protein [Candidatus Magnetaquicoccus inordinatus]